MAQGRIGKVSDTLPGATTSQTGAGRGDRAPQGARPGCPLMGVSQFQPPFNAVHAPLEVVNVGLARVDCRS